MSTRPVELLAYPAARLFVDRVSAVQADFVLGSANTSSVAGICARLEGLPLALELAAARVPALSLPQILERLDDSVRLLVGGSRTAPTRQQTLRATLDWSYSLLNEQERAVFERLAVFAADCSLDAAETVCSADDVASQDVVDLLQRLVDKSLVVADAQRGRTRYRLLEPVRQYARELLVTASELEAVRRRHAMYYLAFGEQRERATNVGGPERPAAAAALVQEYPNIQLAIAWSLESGEAQIGLRLARTVQFLWVSRGYPGEGLGWLERLLVLPGAEEPTAARTVCLLVAGYLATEQDNFEAARAFYEAGLPLAKTIDDPWVQWVGPQNFAVYNWARGDLDTASSVSARSVGHRARGRRSRRRGDQSFGLGHDCRGPGRLRQRRKPSPRTGDGLPSRLAKNGSRPWHSCAWVFSRLHRGDHATARGDPRASSEDRAAAGRPIPHALRRSRGSDSLLRPKVSTRMRTPTWPKPSDSSTESAIGRR